MLEGAGYDVLSADSAESALAELDRGGQSPPSVLLSDVVLSGELSGPELGDVLRKRIPGLRIIYCSGYADEALVGHDGLQPGINLLPKPFTEAQLFTQLSQAQS